MKKMSHSEKLRFINEPYRILFPIGTLFLLWGTLIWLPQIWTHSNYPTLAHRYLMLNGFSASFVAGFLMTAVPKFSQTKIAQGYEVMPFVLLTAVGVICAYADLIQLTFLISACQALLILFFIFNRIHQRKTNPPYSFVFMLSGLSLWFISALASMYTHQDAFLNLHYEGSMMAIILGVGSRLIPGILGHVEIVQTQRKLYETDKPFFLTVPLHFIALILFFTLSYFITTAVGIYIRSLVTLVIGVFYWRVGSFPKVKTSLTWSIWISCWLMILSFFLKAFWIDGFIHASHSFFFSGIVLLTLLVAIRVLQSHGPKDSKLENLKVIYGITFLIILAGATRVSAFLLPEHYLKHLGYSALVLTVAVLLWAFRFLRYV